MKIGIIGGGQLGRMLALAGHPLGLDFVFLDPAIDACAAAVGEHFCAAYDDADALRHFEQQVDLVTFEFENAPPETIAHLAQYVDVYPCANALRTARDRLLEKSLFRELGIATPAFANIESQADLDAAVQQVGLPAVLKTRQLGYDGTETSTLLPLASAAELERAFHAQHRAEFGYDRPDQPLRKRRLRVEASSKTESIPARPEPSRSTEKPEPKRTTRLFYRGAWVEHVPVFLRQRLHIGERLLGPELILEETGTIVVDPGFELEVLANGRRRAGSG